MFKNSFFAIAIAFVLAGTGWGCNQDIRKRLPGSYLTEIQDYENSCNPDDPGPPEWSPLLVRIDAATETDFDFTFGTEKDALVVPDVSVDRHGAWNASYPWRLPNLYNDLTLDITGNGDGDAVTATLTLNVLPLPGDTGPSPVCYLAITISGPRCDETCSY
ncbi:MAG: hypothetical protein AAB562_02170 [Patescibacteria group bacterium]